jgi:uncharacterized coiled-coil DUF342 family protein
LYSVKKEHEVIRKKHAQFNSLQKSVDSIDKAIRTWRSKPAASKRKMKPDGDSDKNSVKMTKTACLGKQYHWSYLHSS